MKHLLRWARNQWDRTAAIGLLLVGLLVLLLGWLGVSRTGLPSEQIPYVVSGGIFGLFLLGVGTTLWLSADIHDEWRKLDALEHAVRADTDAVFRTVALECNEGLRPDAWDNGVSSVAATLKAREASAE